MVVAQREAGLVVGFDGDAASLVGVAPVVEEDEEFGYVLNFCSR